MRSRWQIAACGAFAALEIVVRAGQAAPNPALADVLQRAGQYIAEYEHAMTAVVAQEDYQQTLLLPAAALLNGPASRSLRSDLLVLDAGARGWVSFRDVYEVDGRPVRDHDQRLLELVSHFSPDSLDQVRRIAAEGARFNLSPRNVVLNNNINTPMTALLFLREANQPRSTFTLGKAESIDGVRVVQLSFAEQTKPRLIASRDEAAAHGAFWVDPATGRIVRTQLEMATELSDQSVATRIVATYASVANIDVWVPVTMDETYNLVQSLQTLTGHAEYSHFRQFSVTVSDGDTHNR